MRLLRYFIPLLLATPAAAQTLGLTLTNDVQARDSLTVGPASCDKTIRVTWTATTTTAKCSDGDLRLWLTTESSCGDKPDSTKGDKELGSAISDFTTVRSGDVPFVVSSLPLFTTADAGVSCPTAKQELKYTVCGAFKVASPNSLGTLITCTTDTPFTRAAKSPTLTFDGVPLGRPTIDEVLGLDTALSVRLSGTDGAESLRVYYAPAGDDGGTANPYASGTGTTVTINNLTNNVQYRVTASVIDPAGNESERSTEAFGTPVKTDGFLAIYDGAGGQERGGCQSVSGGAISAMAVLLGIWLSRRRR